MIPNPLHPAVVHFPLVLAFLLPVVVLVVLWSTRRSAGSRRAWTIPLAVAALLAVSSFVALRTGEAEEERVEAVVPEAALHEHEEAAERFLVLGGVLLLVAAAGLLSGTVGAAARLLTAAGSFVVVAAAIQVGAAGGELVYRHDAASVYAERAPGAPSASARPRDDDDD